MATWCCIARFDRGVCNLKLENVGPGFCSQGPRNRDQRNMAHGTSNSGTEGPGMTAGGNSNGSASNLSKIMLVDNQFSLANALLLLCPKCGKACTGQCSTLCVQFCVWRVVRGQICSVACSPRWACHTKCGLNRRRIFNCITFPVCTDSGFTQSSLHWRVVLTALNANTLHLVPDGCQLKAALFSLSHIYGTRSCNSWSNPHQERFAQWEWDQDLMRSRSDEINIKTLVLRSEFSQA